MVESIPVEIPLNQISGFRCAWKGCRESFSGFDIPPDWHVLVITKGWLFDERNLMHSDRDGVLCPKHFDEIMNLLGV